jgi:UTP:GlnB (protein PII) uridylyltransferase
LELVTATSITDPQRLDYVELCREDAGGPDGQSPSLDHFRIERTETGAISLRLFGLDRIGLLSGLLERMEFLGLFPERLRVTTSGQFVDDTIWLRGVAGHMPSPSAEQALHDMLCKLRGPSRDGGG